MSPLPELPDDLRIPLHTLKADARYLFGRVAADGSVAGIMCNSVETRLSHIEEASLRLLGVNAALLAALEPFVMHAGKPPHASPHIERARAAIAAAKVKP